MEYKVGIESMNKEQLKEIIPHREPMLLVDEATLLNPTTAHGKVHITGEEWFVQGHFPGNPVVPGVILCEMMAQAGCVIVADQAKGCTPLFTAIKEAKFKHQVRPGDTLEIECTLLKNRRIFYFIEAKGYVNGELAVSAEFSFALVKGE